MTLIDRYVRDLARMSGGPRSVIVSEAHEHLLDSADSWEARGLTREDAERRAIAEFGSVAELAPAYLAVAALATARRTAVLILLMVGIQPPVWALHQRGSVNREVASALEPLSIIVGLTGLGLAAAGLLLCSAGVRYFGVRAWIVRTATAGAAVTALAAAGLATAWMIFAGGTPSGYVLGVAVIYLPTAIVVGLAIRSWRQLTPAPVG